MINIFKILDFKIFLLSFILGIVFIYKKKKKKHIIVYPTPYNKNKFQFVDKAENCFTYEFEATKCPTDSNKIKKIPVI